MSRSSTPRTDSQLRKELRKVGVCVKKTDGEYRVNKCGRRSDAAAYFTNDRADALYTGMSMAAESRIQSGYSQQRALIRDDEHGISGLGNADAERGLMKTASMLAAQVENSVTRRNCADAFYQMLGFAKTVGEISVMLQEAKVPWERRMPLEAELDDTWIRLQRKLRAKCIRDVGLNGISGLGNISVKPGARVTYSMGGNKSSSGKVTYAGSDVVMVKRDGGGTDTIFYSQIQQVLSSGSKNAGAKLFGLGEYEGLDDFEAVELMFQWHGGQGSGFYSVASLMNGGHAVPASAFERAIREGQRNANNPNINQEGHRENEQIVLWLEQKMREKGFKLGAIYPTVEE